MAKKRFTAPFADFTLLSFISKKMNSGVLLIIVAALAILVANSPLNEYYQALWHHEVGLKIGSFNLFSHHGHPMHFSEFINDALMAIFFFTVGLEIKREILVGHLSSFRQAMLPVIAAIGGMVLPVLIYHILTPEGPQSDGLAIPMATDIAFSLGVLSLFSKRVPVSLKIFLTAFAVVDDIGGIMVIALFYTSHIETMYLLGAGVVLLILFIGNRRRIMARSFYVVLGIVVWYLTLQSGVHSTIAGVAVAFMVPAIPKMDVTKYIARIRDNLSVFPLSKEGPERIILTHDQVAVLQNIEANSLKVVSPLQRLEDELSGLINYFVMPLFAFANAGIVLGSNANLFAPITMGITGGLVIGKFIGILSFTWIAIKLRIVDFPVGMTWRNTAGVALLGGIGFTVSLFISNLTYADSNPELLNQAKMGVLLGTLIAGLLGYFVLYFVLPKHSPQPKY